MRRVSLWIVIPLCAATVAITWWQGTRNLDFMTPPSDAALERVREQTRATVPGQAKLFATVDAPPDSEEPAIPEPIRERPEIDPGDMTKPPLLSTYAESAEKGAGPLIQLAHYVEDSGYPPRALLAWERVLDLCHPDEAQRNEAFAGIQRLRPSVPLWNSDPATSKRLTLLVTVPAKAATPELAATVKAVADDLESVTSGLVKFDSKIDSPKKDKSYKGMSLKISGPGDKPLTTGVFILAEMPADQSVVTYQLFTGIFRLVASQITSTTSFTTPVPPSNGEDPRGALWQRISRLSWLEFAKTLQPPPVDPKTADSNEEAGRRNSGNRR